MSAHTHPLTSAPGAVWRAIRPVAPALVLALLALGVIFATEAQAAWGVWWSSTAYNHGFFIAPIAAYIVWERRDRLRGIPIRPEPRLALLALLPSLLWILPERVGLMEGRQLVAMGIVDVLFLAVLGRRMAAALAAPILYLFFLVPFGAFITPALKVFTTAFIGVGLTVLSIPHFIDANLIEIPEGRFLVADACAGLRFVIASIAFGALYATLMYRGWGRRFWFIVASIIIPIIANGFRALGIVVLGHLLGSASAAATDHVLYGWIFFSIVIFLIILAGLPFREDGAPAAADAPALAVSPPSAGMVWLAALLSVIVGLAGPVASAALSGRSGAPALPALALTAPMGCIARPAKPAGSRFAQDFACGKLTLHLSAQTFPPHASPSGAVAAVHAVTQEASAEDVEIHPLAVPGYPPAAWRLIFTGSPAGARARATATSLWLGGRPATIGLMGRLALARASLLGPGYAPLLIAVRIDWPADQIPRAAQARLRAGLAAFLSGQQALRRLPAMLRR